MFQKLDAALKDFCITYTKSEFEIIEGCCRDSADEYAEEWALFNKIKIHHYPATSGNYLKRNIEMVTEADRVMAFWDGWSYGTAHTISQGLMQGKKAEVVKL